MYIARELISRRATNVAYSTQSYSTVVNIQKSFSPEIKTIEDVDGLGGVLLIEVLDKAEAVAVSRFKVAHYFDVLYASQWGENRRQVLLGGELRNIVDDQLCPVQATRATVPCAIVLLHTVQTILVEPEIVTELPS